MRTDVEIDDDDADDHNADQSLMGIFHNQLLICADEVAIRENKPACILTFSHDIVSLRFTNLELPET